MNVPLGGSWGEDPNLNGVRDKDAMTSDWSETDFLAPDSDVDGLSDGAEEWGRWCYKTESSSACNGVTNRSVRQLWTVSPAKNGALTADFDGDGLRDGQETSGGTVGIWYERTMEKVRNYTVASSPLLADTDSDTLTDFSEFMNGSDPGVSDTDGDGITDPQEIERKSNITGIEGTPPQISNVKLEVGIDWDWWGILWLPLRSHVTVSFDVSDNVGLDTVSVKFIRYTGTETRQLQFSNNPGSYTTSAHVNMKFDFSIFEALVAGADVNITAFDVNGNGAWGDFHVKSVLEAIADAIAAFLSAIAKVIIEAISAMINWIWDAIEAMVRPIVDSILESVHSLGRDLAGDITESIKGNSGADEALSSSLQATYFGSSYNSLLLLILGVAVAAVLITLALMFVFPPLAWLVPAFIVVLLVALVVGSSVPTEGDTIDPGDERAQAPLGSLAGEGVGVPAGWRAGGQDEAWKLFFEASAALIVTIIEVYITFFEEYEEGATEMPLGGFLLEMLGIWADFAGMLWDILGAETRKQAENLNLPPPTLLDKQRAACGDYQASIWLQVVGLIVTAIGVVASAKDASLPLVLLGTFWGAAGTVLLYGDLLDPPPHCNAVSGFVP